MEIFLNHTSTEQSNLFLRALCAKLKKEFGKCAWQFSPHKDGKTNSIFLGYADIGIGEPIEILIKYKLKGVIDRLIFQNLKNDDTLVKHLASIIDYANNTKPSNRYTLTAKIKTTSVMRDENNGINFANVQGEHFSIYTDNQKSFIRIEVVALDKDDSIFIGLPRIHSIRDFLTVCTNAKISITPSETLQSIPEPDPEFKVDEDWIDGMPFYDGKIRLTSIQVQFIDNIAACVAPYTFLKACAHFYNGQKSWSLNSINEHTLEVATVLYVSALEVASELYESPKGTCSKCGQTKYAIRRRVLDLVEAHMGKNSTGLIDDFYQIRSKYLHAGSALSRNNYAGSVIPQLSPESSSGCYPAVAPLPINLMEFVSYILRSVSTESITG